MVGVLKKIAVGLSLALFGGIVGILLLEGFLRVSHVWIGRHSDTLFTLLEYDDTLGWRMIPGENAKVDFVDVEGIPVQVNHAGFWDHEFQVAKPAGRCRIACLGDSFTWGLGVRQGQRFSDILEAEHPAWETMNFGVPGYGADQSVLLWHRIASKYQPDVVVMTIFQNDYVDDIYQVRYGRRKPYFVVKGDGALQVEGVPVSRKVFWDDGVFNRAAPPYRSLLAQPTQMRSRVLEWLVKNSDVVRLTYTILRDHGAATLVSGGPAPTPDAPLAGGAAASALTPADRIEIRLLSALVDDLARSVRRTGARFLVVLAGGSTPQYAAQKKLLDAAGIAYVDATTDVLAAKLGGASKVYFPYNRHWTPASHRAVAELIGDALERMNLCGGALGEKGRAS